MSTCSRTLIGLSSRNIAADFNAVLRRSLSLLTNSPITTEIDAEGSYDKAAVSNDVEEADIDDNDSDDNCEDDDDEEEEEEEMDDSV